MAPTSAEIAQIEEQELWSVSSRATVFEADNVTPFIEDAPILDGQVNLDWSRDERRTLNITLENVGSRFRHPGDFGYDKIVHVWRTLSIPGLSYETKLGEYYIDNFNENNFPTVLEMSCRDGTKRLIRSKFPTTTTFSSGRLIEDLIRTIALNEGSLTKFALPFTGLRTTRAHSFDRGVTRWEAVKEIANAYAYEIFFDSEGFLTMEKFSDPLTTARQFTFQTGPVGNVITYAIRNNDDRIYNHVVVTGEGTDPPLWAEAENDDPNSPTSISKIGRRTYEFVSQFFTTIDQCQNTANAFLQQHALEDYEVSLTTRVFPWLEVGRVSRFIDPSPSPGAPDLYMTSALGIPLKMGTMSVDLKRVVSLT